MTLPTSKFEEKLYKRGFKNIAGIDEVGRGSLAGPLVAGAVILPKHFQQSPLIRDSKQLSEKKRERAFLLIKKNALAIGLGMVSNAFIDSHGIVTALKRAFLAAISKLSVRPDYLLIDGLIGPETNIARMPIIRGDERSVSIAAASIVAKVMRDQLMRRMGKKFTSYAFERNKGYGTREHFALISQYGVSSIHRVSFLKNHEKNVEKVWKN